MSNQITNQQPVNSNSDLSSPWWSPKYIVIEWFTSRGTLSERYDVTTEIDKRDSIAAITDQVEQFVGILYRYSIDVDETSCNWATVSEVENLIVGMVAALAGCVADDFVTAHNLPYCPPCYQIPLTWRATNFSREEASVEYGSEVTFTASITDESDNKYDEQCFVLRICEEVRDEDGLKVTDLFCIASENRIGLRQAAQHFISDKISELNQ